MRSASTRKAVNVTGLEHDGESEYFANAGNALQDLIGVFELPSFKRRPLQGADLLLQGLVDGQSGGNGLLCVAVQCGSNKADLAELPELIRTPVERQIWLCTLISCVLAALTNDSLRRSRSRTALCALG